MKRYKLIINKFAEDDLENSMKYYQERSVGLGTEFMLEVKETLKKIEENPYLFQKIEKEARKANVERFPFAILYIVKDMIINVFSVFHFSRNMETENK